MTGIYGHESVNECIVSDMLDALGIPHTQYEGSVATICLDDKMHTAFVCWSNNFCGKAESKIALDVLYDINSLPDEDIISFMKRLGLWQGAELIIVTDFLFINRDRHGANIEVVKSPNGSIRLAPIFDNGFSLVSPLQNNLEGIRNFNSMLDRQANNFIGSNSLYENLNLLTQSVKVNSLCIDDIRSVVNKYSGDMSSVNVDKIIEIIWLRYSYLEKEGFICH